VQALLGKRVGEGRTCVLVVRQRRLELRLRVVDAWYALLCCLCAKGVATCASHALAVRVPAEPFHASDEAGVARDLSLAVLRRRAREAARLILTGLLDFPRWAAVHPRVHADATAPHKIGGGEDRQTSEDRSVRRIHRTAAGARVRTRGTPACNATGQACVRRQQQRTRERCGTSQRVGSTTLPNHFLEFGDFHAGATELYYKRLVGRAGMRLSLAVCLLEKRACYARGRAALTR